MCTARLFYRGRPLCTQILPRQGRTHQPFLESKTRDTGLPDGEDRILLCSVVLTQYRSVTDRQTNMPPVSYTVLTKLALRRAVKTVVNVITPIIRSTPVAN